MAYIGVSPSNGVRRVHTYTATASQTTFSGAGAEGTSLSYKDSNFEDVYQNGIKLGDADYTSTSGTSIVLAQGASVDDLVVVVVFDVFSVADTVSKADGGTFDGNVTMGGTLGVTGIGTFSDDIVIGDGKTIGSASKTDAITIASSGLVQLTSTGIGAGSQVFQVIDDGATLFQIRAEDGNVSFPQSGAGIYLGVTSGNSANLLDDYEEGTADLAFSSIGSSFSYTYRKCYYTKVGNLVNIIVYMQLDGSNTFSANTVSITGLPFTSVDEAAHQSSSACRVRFFNFDSGFTYLMATVGQNTSEVGLLECGDNVATGGVVANQLSSSSGQIMFNLSYRVP